MLRFAPAESGRSVRKLCRSMRHADRYGIASVKWWQNKVPSRRVLIDGWCERVRDLLSNDSWPNA